MVGQSVSALMAVSNHTLTIMNVENIVTGQQ